RDRQNLLPVFIARSRSEHRLCQLFNEQGDTVRPFDNFRLYSIGKLFVSGDTLNQRRPFAWTETSERERRHVRLTAPRWPELRSERDDEEYGKKSDTLYNNIQ